MSKLTFLSVKKTIFYEVFNLIKCSIISKINYILPRENSGSTKPKMKVKTQNLKIRKMMLSSIKICSFKIV